MRPALWILALVLAAAVLLPACRTASKPTDFDRAAHQQAAALQTETLTLMAQAAEPYSAHQASVDALNAKILARYEAAAIAPDNEPLTRQWELMRDPQGSLFGGFVVAWQATGALDAGQRDEAAARVSAAFDHILCLEIAKGSGGRCAAAGETPVLGTAAAD